MHEIGNGAHAKVHEGTYLGMSVAIKVYENTNPLSLNAFNTELEAFYQKRILSHPHIVPIIGAYQ